MFKWLRPRPRILPPEKVFRGLDYFQTPAGFYRIRRGQLRWRGDGRRMPARDPDEPNTEPMQFDQLWAFLAFEYTNADGGRSERGLLIKSGFGPDRDWIEYVYGLDSQSNEGRTFLLDRMDRVRTWADREPLDMHPADVVTWCLDEAIATSS